MRRLILTPWKRPCQVERSFDTKQGRPVLCGRLTHRLLWFGGLWKLRQCAECAKFAQS